MVVVGGVADRAVVGLQRDANVKQEAQRVEARIRGRIGEVQAPTVAQCDAGAGHAFVESQGGIVQHAHAVAGIGSRHARFLGESAQKRHGGQEQEEVFLHGRR